MNTWLSNFKGKEWLMFSSLSLSFLLFEIIFIILGVDFKSITLTQFLEIQLGKNLFFTILLIIIYYKYLKEKIDDFTKNFTNYFAISFKYWLTGFLIMMISNIIINSYITGLGENENAVQTLISKAPYAAFAMTTLFAPFIEEMIFRKSLQDCFHHKIFYIVTSGFIFGLVHVIGASNPYEYLLIIPYGALGLMFAKTVYETDNIFCTIMMHMLHNGVLTLLAMVAL